MCSKQTVSVFKSVGTSTALRHFLADNSFKSILKTRITPSPVKSDSSRMYMSRKHIIMITESFDGYFAEIGEISRENAWDVDHTLCHFVDSFVSSDPVKFELRV